ncbi:MAG TPA: hypothetical protein VL092_00970 [Chitinophagaceae bacterium]|nr:hypothetical protein [Chitinophagaceae bacterium]
MYLQASDNNLKTAAKIALAPLLILLVGALIFYKERMIIDGAFIVFEIINKGELQIQVERYGSFITQLFPLIAAKCHLPLQAVLMCYSASFTIFPLITALILYRLRAYALVVLLSFYFTLYVTEAYFWTNNELHQGICWLLLLFGLVYSMQKETKKGRAVLNLLGFTLLAFLAIYTHPTVMVPCGFLWGYYLIDNWKGSPKKPVMVIQSVLLCAITIFKYLTSSQNSYDSNFLAKLGKINLQDVLDTFTSGMADVIWKGYLHNYWFIPLLFIAGIVALVRRRKFLLLSFVVLVNLAFFVVLCLLFHGGDTHYIESELMPFAIMGSTAFVYEVLPYFRTKRTLALMLSFIFVVRLSLIAAVIPKFTDRVNKVESMLDEMKRRNITKMIVTHPDGDRQLERELIVSWALPFESMYVSALRGEQPQRTISYKSEYEAGDLQKEDLSMNMVTPFVLWYIPDLNRRYFHIDSTERYTIVPYEELRRGGK